MLDGLDNGGIAVPTALPKKDLADTIYSMMIMKIGALITAMTMKTSIPILQLCTTCTTLRRTAKYIAPKGLTALENFKLPNLTTPTIV